MNKRTFLAFALPFVLLASLTAAAAPNGIWRKVVAPNFTVLTNAEEKMAHEWTNEFTEFVRSLREVIPVSDSRLKPLTIVLFDRERDFAPFKPLNADGTPKEVLGFFSRKDAWAVAGLYQGGLRDEVRRTFFHEGTHWLLSAHDLPNPVWLEEGLAEVFSTFTIKKKQVQWGRAIDDHAIALNQIGIMPLERLLFLAQEDLFTGGYEGDLRTGIAYAQSWAFVHFLLFGKSDVPRSAFMDYVRQLRTTDPDSAFRAAFGAGYAEVDIKLRNYLRNGKYFVTQRPAAEPTVAPLEAASPIDVETALGQLALAAGRLSLSERHASELLRLAPSSPAGYEILGHIQLAGGNETGALAAFQQAAARKSRDSMVHYHLGMARRKHREEGRADSATGKAIEPSSVANHFKRAINVNPHAELAYVELCGLLDLLPGDLASDAPFVRQGAALYPQNKSLQIGLAIIAHRTGKDDEASERLRAVMESPDANPTVRDYAQRLQQSWSHNDTFERIHALIDQRKFADAERMVEEQLAKSSDGNVRTHLLVLKKDLKPARLHEALRQAWAADEWVEARRLVEEILASDVPTRMKAQTTRQLEYLNKLKLGLPPKAEQTGTQPPTLPEGNVPANAYERTVEDPQSEETLLPGS